MNWSPYLAVTGIFLVWRLLLFKITDPDQDPAVFLTAFAANPLSELMTRLRYAFTDVIESSLMVWMQTFRPEIFASNSVYVWGAWGLVLLVAVMTVFYLVRLESYTASPNSATMDARVGWTKQAIIVGAFALFVALLPVWFANREIKLGGLFDRYTLPAMFGACLLVVGLIQRTIRTRLQQIIILSIMVALATGFHFRNADQFRENWLVQKSFFWQLSWRVPGLKLGTAVLIDGTPSSFPGDYAIAAPLNFLYAPRHSSVKLSYWMFNLWEERWAKLSNSGSLEEGARLESAVRSVFFSGSTSNSLAIWFAPPRCLRVLDRRLGDEVPGLPLRAQAAQSISNMDLIVANSGSQVRPPPEIFGREPARSWCYYFQKADWARQLGAWSLVAQRGDEVLSLGLTPSDETEWLPFVEGYIHVGRYGEARTIMMNAFQHKRVVWPALCHLLKRLQDTQAADTARKAFIDDMNAQLSCV